MSEPFEGVYAKLSRADEHLAELRQLISEHLHDPALLTGTIEWRAATRQVIPDYHVKGLPPKVQVVIGDVAHNLRSALEHLAWQLVLANGGNPSRKTQFPICATEPTSPVTITGGVSKAAEKIILAAQPYTKPYQSDHPLAVLGYILPMNGSMIRSRRAGSPGVGSSPASRLATQAATV